MLGPPLGGVRNPRRVVTCAIRLLERDAPADALLGRVGVDADAGVGRELVLDRFHARARRASSPASPAARASRAAIPPLGAQRRSRGRLARGRSAGSAGGPPHASGRPSGCGSNRTGRSSHHARGAATAAPPPLASCHENLPHPSARRLRERKSPANAGLSQCAEEDSNLHPVIPDQALNLVTRLSDTSYASRSSRTSGNLDGMDAMDDLDVAADVATRSRRFYGAGGHERG